MEETKEEFDVQKFLIAEGLDSCRRSYRDSKCEESYSIFMSLAIIEIMPYWRYFSKDIKSDYVTKNIDVFFDLAVKNNELEENSNEG